MLTYSIHCERCGGTVRELVGHTHRHHMPADLRAEWDYVVQRLGSQATLTVVEQRKVRCYADGFGRISEREMPEAFWDWSHVRDSSDAAVVRMAWACRMVEEERRLTKEVAR